MERDRANPLHFIGIFRPANRPLMSSSPRFAAYKSALQAISTRTGTPLPSLVLSFAILHEVTAIAPLFAGFYAARTLGVGERVVSYVADSESTGWMQDKMKSWMEEGEQKAERIGRRYELFGYEKGTTIQRLNIAGDIANFVVAYGATKVGNRYAK